MNEDALTRKLARRWPLIGDDCAVVRSPSGVDLLFTSDFSIEGVHFTRRSSAEEIGYRAVARGLSDIAAMGGTPLYCLISLALAPWTNERWIDGFYRGVERLLRRTKTALAGGDISHAREVVADLWICGSVPRGKALSRSGARAGDLIYVSRPLGGWRFKPVFEPRLGFGRKLLGKATACMDISDGLALDLHRMAFLSGVEARLDRIPLLKGAT
ncbi:MAG TPA: thiamine-phosphate kinase, partial [Bryobacteraceae bacterium]|nr:thiamine-phosphate kinase [Bryobacteraceae bacterium]